MTLFIIVQPPIRWKSKKYLKVEHLIMLGVILLTMLMLPGCNQSGYQTFTAKNSLGQFYLEYPSVYREKDGPTLNLKDEYFTVSFLYPDKAYKMVNPDPNTQDTKTVTVYHEPALIHIFISNRGSSAKTLFEDGLTRASRWANFNLLERSTISISSIPAEYAHFVSSSLLPMRPAPGEEIPLKHYWQAYFNYNDLVWRVELESEGEMAEQAKADFEHVIQTFKILN
jgi:hypothetical protein